MTEKEPPPPKRVLPTWAHGALYEARREPYVRPSKSEAAAAALAAASGAQQGPTPTLTGGGVTADVLKAMLEEMGAEWDERFHDFAEEYRGAREALVDVITKRFEGADELLLAHGQRLDELDKAVKKKGK